MIIKSSSFSVYLYYIKNQNCSNRVKLSEILIEPKGYPSLSS